MQINQQQFHKILEDPSGLKNLFFNEGWVHVVGAFKNPSPFRDFVDRLTLTYSNDAARRGDRFGSSRIKNVDPGLDAMTLHSESSFSPNCPQAIWFYCNLAPTVSGENTTVCDGVKVWRKLSTKTKSFLLANPIEYKLSVDLGRNKLPNRDWFIDRIGCGSARISEGRVEFVSKRYAVNEVFDMAGRVHLAFANHLFADLSKEDQIVSRTVHGREIPRDILQECTEVCDALVQDVIWSKGDMVLLNNHRFMHGRRAISAGSKRDIVIIQSERVKF